MLLLSANLRVLEIISCELPNSGGHIGCFSVVLKACEIAHCPGIEYVWWADNCITSLNALHLNGLPALRVLFKLRPRENISSNLKHLVVSGCHNLKHLFTADLVKYHLQNLQSIFVYYCNEMEDMIVATSEEEGNNINEMNDDLIILCFPNLVSFGLAEVPKLRSIWKGKLICDSLQRLLLLKCPNLRRLSLSEQITTTTDAVDAEIRASSPPLKGILAEKQWWDGVEWDSHSLAKSLFQPIFQPLPRQFEVDPTVCIILYMLKISFESTILKL